MIWQLCFFLASNAWKFWEKTFKIVSIYIFLPAINDKRNKSTMTFKLSIVAGAFGVLAFTAPALADAPACEIDRPVVFGDLDWASAQFHNRVAAFIVEHGYGCETDAIPGSTLPIANGLQRGDVDINMEMWIPNVRDWWDQATAAGDVRSVGVNFPDAVQGWFVPRYLIEGADAPAPDLRAVSDLPRYAELFADPEAPGMGRFYNCIAGWGCEDANTRKLHAYGLTETFTNFRPGTGGALAAAAESAVLRGEPIVFYYWGPTWLLGKIGTDLVMLEEPEYDAEIWAELQSSDNPTRAVAYPNAPVHIGGNTEFVEAAPAIADFLRAYETTTAETSAAIAYMEDNDAEARDAAAHFLSTTTAWEGWLPAEVAARVRAAL